MELIKVPMIGVIECYMENNQDVPVPINEEDFKGNIAYRTTSRRHFLINKEAQRREQSLSQVLDSFVDLMLLNKSKS